MKVYIILHTFEGTDRGMGAGVNSEIYGVYANQADALVALTDLYNDELKLLANYNIESDECFDDDEDAMEFEINGDVYSSAQIIEQDVMPASEKAIRRANDVYVKATWICNHYTEIAPAIIKALDQVAEEAKDEFNPDNYLALEQVPIKYLAMAYDILKPPHLKNVSIEDIKVSYVENYGDEDRLISKYFKQQGITPHQLLCISGEGLLDIWNETYGKIK